MCGTCGAGIDAAAVRRFRNASDKAGSAVLCEDEDPEGSEFVDLLASMRDNIESTASLFSADDKTLKRVWRDGV